MIDSLDDMNEKLHIHHTSIYINWLHFCLHFENLCNSGQGLLCCNTM